MWPFRKKKIFQITWSYVTSIKDYFIEVIRAVDIAAAWAKIRKQHDLPISLIEWKEVE